MNKLFRTIIRFPLISFILFLGLLLAVIALGNAVRAPDAVQQNTTSSSKKVEIQTTQTTTISVSGAVDNENIVTVRATANGIVSHVFIKEGMRLGRGAQIVTLADNYSGGNVASATRRSAVRNTQFQNETFDKNISIIDDQRDDVHGSGLQKEIARKQLTIQKRTAEFAHEVAAIEVQRATVAAAAYYPRTPIAGTVERVFVNVGERVTIGDPLAVIYGNGNKTTVTVTVDATVAQALSVTEPTILTVAGTHQIITVLPAHIAAAPTSNQLYSIVYIIEDSTALPHGTFIDVELPLNPPSNGRYVPIDAVTLTHDGAMVFITDGEYARAKTVTLGAVLGSTVIVTDGLSLLDSVILNRNVIDGDIIIYE